MPRPQPHELVCQVNDRAFRVGVSIPELVRRAGVPRVTWMRLKNGGDPRASTIDALNLALDLFISEDSDA